MLQVANLSFDFPHRPLFRGLSFELRPGAILHVKGPNGCGKSTLLAVIAGLLAPKTGTIHVKSSQSGENSEAGDSRHWFGYLPAEANGLFCQLNAFENMNFWARLRNTEIASDQIVSALNKWGIDARWFGLGVVSLPVAKFSTGMKRRLAMARLELSSASCWLLDEPFYGLDQQGVEMFRGALEAHLKKGGCAMIVSHDAAVKAFSNLSDLALAKEYASQ